MKNMITCIDEMPADQRSDYTGRVCGLIQFSTSGILPRQKRIARKF
jgi:hypothetical protein